MLFRACGDKDATFAVRGNTLAMLFLFFSDGPRARGTIDVRMGLLMGRPATNGRASPMLLLNEIAGDCVIAKAIVGERALDE